MARGGHRVRDDLRGGYRPVRSLAPVERPGIVGGAAIDAGHPVGAIESECAREAVGPSAIVVVSAAGGIGVVGEPPDGPVGGGDAAGKIPRGSPRKGKG